MNVSLSPQLERFVKQKVRDGQLQSAQDVIRGALESMQQQETLTPQAVEELRREIAIGIDDLNAGGGEPWDVRELKAEGRRLLNARKRRVR